MYGDYWVELVDVEVWGFLYFVVCLCLVLVVFNGIDFVVVGEYLEWVCQWLVWQCVGGEVLVEYDCVGGQVVVLQVWVEVVEFVWQYYVFVVDCVWVECGDVVVGVVVQLLFVVVVGQEQCQGEGGFVLFGIGIDEYLFDVWQCVVCQLVVDVGIGGYYMLVDWGVFGCV